ncbi:MAG: patatin-like phospholipase family protein [Gammaproteobacteria bacterium]
MAINNSTKTVNLALQGGGAHGAFAWGVLDRLIEDGRLQIDGLTATSAGSMNASVYAYGKMMGGPDGAREALHNFWRKISQAGELYSPIKYMPLSFLLFETWTRLFSPYQFNPFNFNPLRQVLSESVDFEKLVMCKSTNLFINTTNARTGRVRVFRNEEITLDVVLASACLPFLFQAVEIDGEHYWDGGYTGNPPLHPLFYHTQSRDVVILHINPMYQESIPTQAPEIANRINEISFNSSLLKELRAIAFVNKLLEEGWLKDEYRSKLKHVLVHSIHADSALGDLTLASKFNCDWNFLTELRDRGRQTAEQWLDQNFEHIGERATVDLREEYLGESSLGKSARRGRVRDEDALPQPHSGITLQRRIDKPAARSQSGERDAPAASAAIP